MSVSKLTGHMSSMIILGLKQSGIGYVPDTLSYIEESLTPDEYRGVEGFLRWASEDWEGRSIGHGNIRDRWQEYRRTVKVSTPKGPVCAHCHLSLTVLESVSRRYHGLRLGSKQRTSVRALGHYTVDGTFEPDGSVVLPECAQTYDGDDACASCGHTVG